MLAAIWGLETLYGTVLDDPKYIKPIIPSLATLVYMKRSRLKGDTADFVAALKLVQRGPLDAKHLLGSWCAESSRSESDRYDRSHIRSIRIHPVFGCSRHRREEY